MSFVKSFSKHLRNDWHPVCILFRTFSRQSHGFSVCQSRSGIQFVSSNGIFGYTIHHEISNRIHSRSISHLSDVSSSWPSSHSRNIYPPCRHYSENASTKLLIAHPITSTHDEREEWLQTIRTQMCKVEKKDVDLVEEKLSVDFPGKTLGPSAKQNVLLLLALALQPLKVTKVFKVNHLFFSEESHDKIISNVHLLIRFGVTELQIARSLYYYSGFITFQTEILREVLEFWRDELPEVNVGKVISQNPAIFCTRVPELRKKMSHFTNLGFRNVPKLVETFPTLLNLRPSSVRRKIKFFENLFQSDVIDFLEHAPRLLGTSELTIQKKFRWLKDRFGSEHTLKLIQSHLGILSCSFTCLEDKMDFVCNVMQRGVGDIVKTPSVFKYSLKKRLIPRYEALKSKDFDKKYSLSFIFGCSNDDFEKKFKVNLVPVPNY